LEALRRAEQMAGGAGVDKQVLIGAAAHGVPHRSQAADELRDRQLELADEHAARGGNRKA
jgi:hypothetical protein